MQVPCLGREDPLENEMTTHSNILSRRIPWTEEPGGLQSMSHKESDMTDDGAHSKQQTAPGRPHPGDARGPRPSPLSPACCNAACGPFSVLTARISASPLG